MKWWLVIGAAMSLALPVRADHPADLFPEDTLLFVGTPGMDAREAELARTRFGQLLGDPRMIRIGEQLESLQRLAAAREPEAEAMRRLLEETIQHPVGVGLLDFGVGPDGPQAQVAAVVDIGDGALDYLQMLLAILTTSGIEVDEAPLTIEGHAFRVARLGEGREPIYAGVVDRYVVVGWGVQSVARMIPRFQGRAASLSDATELARARELIVDADRIDLVVLDVPRARSRLLEVLADVGQALPEPLAVLLAEGAAVSRVGRVVMLGGMADQGFRLGIRVPISGLEAAAPPLDDASLAWAPADSIFVSGARRDHAADYIAIRDFVLEMASDEEERTQIRTGIARAEMMLGASFEQLLRDVGEQCVLFEEPSSRGLLPGLVLVLTPESVATIQAFVEQIVRLGGGVGLTQGVGVEIRKVMRAGHEIQFVHLAGAPIPVAPAWVQTGDRLLLALHPTVLEDVLRRRAEGGPTILDRPDFQRARAALPRGRYSGLMYCDGSQFIRWIYPSTIPVLQALIGLGARFGVDLDASVIPSPRWLSDHFFGDICAWRVDEGGFLWVSHSATPIPLGGAALVGVGGAVLGVVGGVAGSEPIPVPMEGGGR